MLSQRITLVFILMTIVVFLSLTIVSGRKLQKLRKDLKQPFVLYVGKRRKDEQLLSVQSFVKKAKEASAMFRVDRGDVITRVQLLDRTRDRNSGGIPDIEEGGKGYDYMKVHFKTKHARDINFIAEFWGIRNEYPPSYHSYDGSSRSSSSSGSAETY